MKFFRAFLSKRVKKFQLTTVILKNLKKVEYNQSQNLRNNKSEHPTILV